jgi:hypothetical protein
MRSHVLLAALLFAAPAHTALAEAAGVPAPAPAAAASNVSRLIEKCKVACHATFMPVCCTAASGTYLNACWATCIGAAPFVDGECGAAVDRFRHAPNDCEAHCANAPNAVFAPVCGENGFTYSSACMASCSSVLQTTAGNCCKRRRRACCVRSARVRSTDVPVLAPAAGTRTALNKTATATPRSAV